MENHPATQKLARRQLDLIKGVDTGAIQKTQATALANRYTSAMPKVPAYPKSARIARSLATASKPSYSASVRTLGASLNKPSYAASLRTLAASLNKPSYAASMRTLGAGITKPLLADYIGKGGVTGLGRYEPSTLAKALRARPAGYDPSALAKTVGDRPSGALSEALERRPKSYAEIAKVELEPLPAPRTERIDFDEVASAFRIDAISGSVERILLTAELAVAEHKEAQHRAEAKAEVSEGELRRIADAVEATENRNRFMVKLTVASVAFAGLGGVAAVVAVFSG